jgi:catechol 2,3-dioxygenase-like lactoylglutathione lyase family enzyme
MNVAASTVSLTVADAAASSRFFTTYLGFREVMIGEDFISLSRDDGAPDIVLLQRDPTQPPADRPGQGLADVTISFAVTNLLAESARLGAEGATITRPLRKEPWGELSVQLTDPNGVVVQLTEWVPPAGM